MTGHAAPKLEEWMKITAPIGEARRLKRAISKAVLCNIALQMLLQELLFCRYAAFFALYTRLNI
jgi:hypothetical protein